MGQLLQLGRQILIEGHRRSHAVIVMLCMDHVKMPSKRRRHVRRLALLALRGRAL